MEKYISQRQSAGQYILLVIPGVCTQEGKNAAQAERCGFGFSGPAEEMVIQTVCVGSRIGDGFTPCEKKGQPIVQLQGKAGCVTLPRSLTDGGKVQEGAGYRLVG